jgi:hypothetical protein
MASSGWCFLASLLDPLYVDPWCGRSGGRGDLAVSQQAIRQQRPQPHQDSGWVGGSVAGRSALLLPSLPARGRVGQGEIPSTGVKVCPR